MSKKTARSANGIATDFVPDRVRVARDVPPLSDPPAFIGVKTTNIYCFPWCNGRPKPENIVSFPSRQAAEQAGYRPCKSCYSALPAGKWRDHKTAIELMTPKEFSFTANLGYLTRSTNECMFQVENNQITRLIQAHDQAVLVQISSEHEGSMLIRFVHAPARLKKSTRVAVARYVWDWFDLDTDLAPFYRLAGADPLLSPLVNQLYGLRIMGIPDLFEALVWGIIGQQINLAFAYELKRRFVAAFGEHLTWQDRTYPLFPAPQTIAALSPADLTALQFTGKKAEYVLEVARQITAGTLSRQALLASGDYKEAERALVSIRGIGPWTANYVMMRCLRDPAAFPIADVGLHNALKVCLNLERKPTIPEIQQLAESWQGWEAYATFYLWRSLY